VPPKKWEKTRLAKRFLTPAPHENGARNLLEGAGAKAKEAAIDMEASEVCLTKPDLPHSMI
jgi:hypothetical protein